MRYCHITSLLTLNASLLIKNDSRLLQNIHMILKPSLVCLYSLFSNNSCPKCKTPGTPKYMQFLGRKKCHASEPLCLLLPLSRRQYLLYYLTKFINKILLRYFNLLNSFRICSHNNLKWILY